MQATRTLATLLGVGTLAHWLRRRMLRWGATAEEVGRPSPGADVIPGGKLSSTMAATIDAPPSRLWPWLVQMGFDRGGWYSWDRLDRYGIPSTWTIHPEWQALTVGQRLQADRKGNFWFEVAAIEPERFLALRSAMTPLGHQYDTAGPRPRYFSEALWSFELAPLAGDRTRLVVRTYGVSRPRWFRHLVGSLFWEPAHWIMQARQFTNLKRRAERPLIEHREAAPLSTPAVP